MRRECGLKLTIPVVPVPVPEIVSEANFPNLPLPPPFPPYRTDGSKPSLFFSKYHMDISRSLQPGLDLTLILDRDFSNVHLKSLTIFCWFCGLPRKGKTTKKENVPEVNKNKVVDIDTHLQALIQSFFQSTFNETENLWENLCCTKHFSEFTNGGT